jgi:hypothetical protein
VNPPLGQALSRADALCEQGFREAREQLALGRAASCEMSATVGAATLSGCVLEAGDQQDATQRGPWRRRYVADGVQSE